MMAVNDLPAVQMSPPIRLPTSVPLMSQNAEASNPFMQDVPNSQAIVPIPPPSNFAIVQAHANTSAMGASERSSMQAQIGALRNQLS